MYVCLCVGVTKHEVDQAIAQGAATTKQVAKACGAGSQCGRCRRTVRAILDSTPATPKPRWVHRIGLPINAESPEPQ
jgi:bacterioferritin-associated ferredoxin